MARRRFDQFSDILAATSPPGMPGMEDFKGGGVPMGSTGMGADVVAQMPGATAAPSGAGTGAGVMAEAGKKGILGKILGGFDPLTAILGGLSLFGGGSDGPKMGSFRDVGGEAGRLVDPINALYNAMGASERLGQGLQDRGPRRLSPSSVVQAGPPPINIPGLGFQIGGGLGRDPAIDDASLLEGEDPRDTIFKYDPFGNPEDRGRETQPAVRRRRP